MTNQHFPLSLHYKGFSATIERVENTSLLTGHLTGLLKEMDFAGHDLQEIEQAFHRSMDEFLKLILADYAQSIEINDEGDSGQQNASKTIIAIHLPDKIVQQIHAYGQGRTEEEFIVDLVTEEIKSRQRSEDIWRVFDEWDNSFILIEAIPLKTFSLRVKFKDGLEGEYDMKSTIQNGGEYSKLANLDFFQKIFITENGNSIFWSEGIEISADVIYETIRATLDKAEYG
jgi:hypothetical protein